MGYGITQNALRRFFVIPGAHAQQWEPDDRLIHPLHFSPPPRLQSTDCQDTPCAATSSCIAERRAYMHSGRRDPPLETPKTKRTGSMLTTAFVNTKLRQRTVESSESSAIMSPVTPQPCISSNYRKQLQSSRTEGKGMTNTATAVTAVSGLNGRERPPPTDSETTGPVDIDALVRREQKSGRTARTSVHMLTNKFEHYSADRQTTPECVLTSKQPSGGLTFAHETLELSNKQSFQSPRTMPFYLSSICTGGKVDQPHGMSQDVRAIDEPKVLLSQRKVTEEVEEVINLPAKPPQTILRPEGTSTEAFVDKAETPKPEIKVTPRDGLPIWRNEKSRSVRPPVR
ncbi:unnamed protein product [Dibothriocephalus latus]|uniref:Uncharacterized protein n=1 Tax=Dibothriocephalus latus TaxID=60516 RepID=A0A3P7LTI0_DIBLA|nr:unnamed protein product [Dibothriocephalus latus]